MRDATQQARTFVEELAAQGVRHACVCPGARSTPLALALASEARIRAWSLVDERSAAFFGLGIARTLREPVAIVCTSGTAAANFLPAIVEAFYAHAPLIVLTADRPPELRDCGAAQTIDQIKMFGGHVRWFCEAGMPDAGERYFRAIAGRAVAEASAAVPGPVHLNFPFREPLLPVDATSDGGGTVHPSPRPPARTFHRGTTVPDRESVERLASILSSARHGWIVCGPQDDVCLAEKVSALAADLDFPVFADPLSQLRCGSHDRSRVVAHYEALLRAGFFSSERRPEVVLRFGAMPRCKPLLQYLEALDAPQVVVDSAHDGSDPGHSSSDVVRADAVATCEALRAALRDSCGGDSRRAAADLTRAVVGAGKRAGAAVRENLFSRRELCEPRVFQELAALLPAEALVYVGNSMPVRDLEAFWPAGERSVRFLCNHGANGIDGFVSSGLGAAAVHDGPVVMVTGDLGFYHDLNGLLAVSRHGLRATVVVLNNDGGGIFSFLPQARAGEAFEEYFATPHGLDFRCAAEMYGAAFRRVASWEQFRDVCTDAIGGSRATIIEVPCQRDRNVVLHRELWEATAGAIA